MKVVKPNLGVHAERANNTLNFDQAYALALASPNRTYRTAGDQTEFVAIATTGKRGKHKDERVLRFMTEGKERARAYPCCWGHRTNCNRTHIDIYTSSILFGDATHASEFGTRMSAGCVVEGTGGSSARDEFSIQTKQALAARVGNRCSNPDCRAVTSGPQDNPAKALNVGVAAHITAAAGRGPRYRPSLSAESRRHADNGIWLCQNCAKLVDNEPDRFPESLLHAWKTVAEQGALSSLGKPALTPVETESQRKLNAILPWKGKNITLAQMNTGRAVLIVGPVRGRSSVKLLDCNQHFVTISSGGSSTSIPLGNIHLSYDSQHDCLELQERYS